MLFLKRSLKIKLIKIILLLYLVLYSYFAYKFKRYEALIDKLKRKTKKQLKKFKSIEVSTKDAVSNLRGFIPKYLII